MSMHKQYTYHTVLENVLEYSHADNTNNVYDCIYVKAVQTKFSEDHVCNK
jgi:hypothetical protein